MKKITIFAAAFLAAFAITGCSKSTVSIKSAAD